MLGASFIASRLQRAVAASWTDVTALPAGEPAAARVALVPDHDIPDGRSREGVPRRAVGRDRLDEPFLFVGPNRNDDLVRRKARKSIADGELDVRLAGNSINGLAREL